jgi:hypothetical protein
MSTYSLTHLSDQVLLADLAVLLAADRHTTAAFLAHIAEVDARGLYLPAACSSMHGYCMRVLHLPEDAAFKRIRAARAARRFPQIFVAIADGRLHLSGVVLLAPHLTDDNADDLLAAACHKSKGEIEVLLAERAPRPDVPTTLVPLLGPAGSPSAEAVAPGPPHVPPPSTTKVTPLAPKRFALQLTIDQATQEKLLRAQALLRHRLPSGDLAQVLDRALDALLATLSRDKFGATTRPRAGKDHSANRHARHVPNQVKRAVHARDGEQCSFVSPDGARCTERGFLEIDHIDPVARGGQATVQNARMLCQPHNQYEAERVFGAAFMHARRSQACNPAIDLTPAPAPTPAPATCVTVDAAPASEMESLALLGMRGLGFTATEARTAVIKSAHLPASTLEQRLRVALAVLHPTHANRCSEEAAVPWQSSSPTRLRLCSRDSTLSVLGLSRNHT